MKRKEILGLAALLLLAGCGKNTALPFQPDDSPVVVTADRLRPAGTVWEQHPWSYKINRSGPQAYSIEREGLWGLILETGEEVLPCRFDAPVERCSLGHWYCRTEDPSWETWGPEFDRISAEVEALSGLPLCPGHGGSVQTFFLDSSEPSPMPKAHWAAPGDLGVFSLDETAYPPEDAYFPAAFGSLYLSMMGEALEVKGWNFSDQAGDLLCPGECFDSVGWFYGEALAPVEQGGYWAYINTEGEFVTDFVYESCWGSFGYDSESGQYQETLSQAYGLWGGYAPVCREGRWGVLDKNGREIVPCEFDGAAPYPGGVWLREGDCWILKLILKRENRYALTRAMGKQ